MQAQLKRLTVGTAAALLAAGCSSTGSTGTSAAVTPTMGTPTAVTETAGTHATVTQGGVTTSAPSSAATGTSLASVETCDRQPVTEPQSYVLACADAGIALEQLVWSNWGGPAATAAGVQIQNGCVPSCAAGSPVSTKATATLSGLSGGHYTKLHVVTAKGTSDYTIDANGPVVTGAR